MRAFRGAGYWEHGWRAINDTLHFIQRRPTSEDPAGGAKLETLIALERDFRPRSLDDFFDTFVLGEPWRHCHPNGSDRKLLRSASTLSRARGSALKRRHVPLERYLDRAASANGTNRVEPLN